MWTASDIREALADGFHIADEDLVESFYDEEESVTPELVVIGSWS